MTPLEIALAYAEAGVAVIPCEPASKEPVWALVPKDIGPDRKPIPRTGGVKKATRDPAKIAEWWAARPDAMIGGATGAASGFWAIDPDVPKPAKNGHAGKLSADGAAAWEKLKAEHGGHAQTVEVTTPSGGRHIYFKCDPAHPLGNGEGNLSGLGINVRGNGGYVIMPPSRRWPDGKAYEANRPFDPGATAEAPGWLYELIRPPRKPSVKKMNGDATSDPAGFPCTPVNERKLRDALSCIPAAQRAMWWKIGAAINALQWGARGREIWDEWSRSAPEMFDPEDQDETWEGFDPARAGGATAGSIFHEAKEHGWKPAAAEQWTELGNARRLVRHNGENIRYVHPLKAWFIWDDVFWRRDDSGGIMRRAEATIEAIFDGAKEIADDATRQAFRKFALKSQTHGQFDAMVQLAQHNLKVVLSPDKLDTNPMLLGVLNGTIDLNTGTFRGSRREDYITKQCAVAFDRAAQCPNWIEFQKKIAGGNAELVAYKQRVFGVLLTGEMVEILFILHGDGSNGKTTELETIQGVLGDYAHAVDAKLMLSPNDRSGATPEIVALKGKRAIFINESGDSDHLNESRVKYLCGNDTMSGRDLFEKPINFRPTHKTLLRTNHKPKIPRNRPRDMASDSLLAVPGHNSR